MLVPKLRFMREDGADYPEWKKKAISELFEISAGGDIDKSNSVKEYSEDYPYAVYANALTNKGLYGYANYYKIKQDCFTVTGRGDVGYAIARHEKFVPIVRLLVCVPKHDENVDCFAEIVNNTSILVESTGVPQLTSIQLGKIKVAYPIDLEEQQKIADLLSAVDEVIAQSEAEVILQDGDIILADTAEDETVGKAIEIYHTGTSKVVSGLHTMTCRPNDKYAPKYMGYYINSPTYHNQLLPYMQGIKVTSIGRKNIADTVIYYPADLEEQQKIADFLSAYDEVISYAKQELDKWKELKQGLLQQMFV